MFVHFAVWDGAGEEIRSEKAGMWEPWSDVGSGIEGALPDSSQLSVQV